MKLSVLIPVYNEAATVEELLGRVRAAARPGLDLEIVVVDDGSADGTAARLDALARREPGAITVLRHPANRGKGAAVRTGLAAATGEAVLIQDADLEYDPADYARLVEPMERDGAPVVYGSRIRGDNPHSYLRYYYGGRLLTLVFNLLYGTRLTDVTTCYKLFRREVIAALPLACDRFEFCVEATARLARRGIPIVEVPIVYRPRSLEAGKKIRWHDGARSLWIMLSLRWLPPSR